MKGVWMNTRTNIVLDDELIAKAMARAHVSTKKAAVEAALRAFVREPDYASLLALEGSRLISDDYDPDESYKVFPHEPMHLSDNIKPYVVKLTSQSAPKANTVGRAKRSAAKPARA
jgi:Arc/MetJ family transcription regulator